MRAYHLLLTAAALATAGCNGPARLDWFLYVPTRVDAYRLDPNGPTPETTVLPDRLKSSPSAPTTAFTWARRGSTPSRSPASARCSSSTARAVTWTPRSTA